MLLSLIFLLVMQPRLAVILAVFVSTHAAAMNDPNTKISEEMLKIRDPFKRPMFVKRDLPKTELELFPLDQLRLMGVVTGPNRIKAMVVAPNGKTYFVSENMKLGSRGGLVKRITPHSIFVKEKVMNVLGQEETLDSELRLPVERRAE